MKPKSYYTILIGLIIIGVASFNFYQKKEEERLLAFEGYEISTIEDRVNDLYNEEKTDLAKDIPIKEFEELEELFSDLAEKDLRNQSDKQITGLHVEFLTAREMHEIQTGIEDLFDRRTIIEDATFSTVERLENRLEAYSDKTVYYDRNKDLVKEATDQLTTIKDVREFVSSLLNDEGSLMAGLTQEELDEALERVKEIRNRTIRSELEALLDGEIEIIEEEDEEEIIEEIIEEIEEPVVEEPEVTTPTPPTREPEESTSSGPGNNNDSTDDSNTDSNNQLDHSDSDQTETDQTETDQTETEESDNEGNGSSDEQQDAGPNDSEPIENPTGAEDSEQPEEPEAASLEEPEPANLEEDEE